MADLFAPVRGVARAGSPSYTDSTPLVMQFMVHLPGVVVCKHHCSETSIKHITIKCPVGGECMGIDSFITLYPDNLV